ncbi:hypothetical protein scyTo_0010794 [Scyliorhinus torazame]|uniref:EF-hand domain-containing protein n=1 Tax=Scyliorhinus torazame TaxID=75743 RepID=A0A401PBL5_SCYTO|nr:hypothetical protein [Scyliorhinus torazame]
MTSVLTCSYYRIVANIALALGIKDRKRCKMEKRKLTKQEIDAMVAQVATVKQSTNLFRDLNDKGLISYTEYLFLLGILTKPHAGFHIAFSMLDIDGNQQVEKKEFLVLQNIIRQKKEVKPGTQSALVSRHLHPGYFLSNQTQNNYFLLIPLLSLS